MKNFKLMSAPILLGLLSLIFAGEASATAWKWKPLPFRSSYANSAGYVDSVLVYRRTAADGVAHTYDTTATINLMDYNPAPPARGPNLSADTTDFVFIAFVATGEDTAYAKWQVSMDGVNWATVTPTTPYNGVSASGFTGMQILFDSDNKGYAPDAFLLTGHLINTAASENPMVTTGANIGVWRFARAIFFTTSATTVKAYVGGFPNEGDAKVPAAFSWRPWSFRTSNDDYVNGYVDSTTSTNANVSTIARHDTLALISTADLDFPRNYYTDGTNGDTLRYLQIVVAEDQAGITFTGDTVAVILQGSIDGTNWVTLSCANGDVANHQSITGAWGQLDNIITDTFIFDFTIEMPADATFWPRASRDFTAIPKTTQSPVYPYLRPIITGKHVGTIKAWVGGYWNKYTDGHAGRWGLR